jgi:membrane protein YdbS with pleckstrin-like domain
VARDDGAKRPLTRAETAILFGAVLGPQVLLVVLVGIDFWVIDSRWVGIGAAVALVLYAAIGKRWVVPRVLRLLWRRRDNETRGA